MNTQIEILEGYLQGLKENTINDFEETARADYRRMNDDMSPTLDYTFFTPNENGGANYYLSIEDLYEAETSVNKLTDVFVALIDISNLKISYFQSPERGSKPISQYTGITYGVTKLADLGEAYSEKALQIDDKYFYRKNNQSSKSLSLYSDSLISDDIDAIESYQDENKEEPEEKVSLMAILELEQVVLEKLLYNLEHPEELTEFEQLKIMDDSAHIIKRILETNV